MAAGRALLLAAAAVAAAPLRGAAADKAPTEKPEPAKGEEECHTAHEGEKCWDDVWWAKHYGMKEHPEWYKGLTNESSSKAVQAFLHANRMGSGAAGFCSEPCWEPGEEAREVAPTSTTAEPTSTTAEGPAAGAELAKEMQAAIDADSDADSDEAATVDSKVLVAVDPESPSAQVDVGNASETLSCIEKDTTYEPEDMLGHILTYEDNVSACQARCASIVGCAHYSYWVPGQHCHVQDVAATAVPSSEGYLAGPPGCLPGEESEATRAIQEEMDSCYERSTAYLPTAHLASAGSISECQLLCEQAEDCAHFSFGIVSGRCGLAAAGATGQSVQNFVSGPRACEHARLAFMRKFLAGRGERVHGPSAAPTLAALALFAGLGTVVGMVVQRRQRRTRLGERALVGYSAAGLGQGLTE